MLSPPSDGSANRFSPNFLCLFLGKHNHKMIFSSFLLSRQQSGALVFTFSPSWESLITQFVFGFLCNCFPQSGCGPGIIGARHRLDRGGDSLSPSQSLSAERGIHFTLFLSAKNPYPSVWFLRKYMISKGMGNLTYNFHPVGGKTN